MDKLRTLSLPLFLLAGLAACDSRTAQAKPPPAPPAASGAVNPDAGVTAYRCADGQTIVAGYPDRATAVVTYKDHAYTLKRAASASGARYTGYGLQWWVKGARADLAALKPGEDAAREPGLACVAGDAEPVKPGGGGAAFAPSRT